MVSTTVKNAYHNLILGLLELLLTYFGFIYAIFPELAISGITLGMWMMDAILQLDTLFEIIGLSLGLAVFTIISVFRREKGTKDT
jgi:uncharacterized RDD family membrane protein YckC